MTNKKNDPFAKRESEKYEIPVPSREHLLEVLETIGVPMGLKALIKHLGLTLPDEHEGLRRRLRAMARDAQIMCDRRNRYCLINKLDLVTGIVSGHPDGYGFLVTDNKDDDYYLTSQEMQGLIHGDKILARLVFGRKGKFRAEAKEIVKKTTTLMGKFIKTDEFTYVNPLNFSIRHNIILSKSDEESLEDGTIVVINLKTHPFDSPQVLGEVMSVLGTSMEPGLETDVTIFNHAIPNHWPKEVLEQAASLHDIEPESSDWRDYTKLPFVTIDGDDSKDFDDAVYCKKSPVGWELFVAIAHVSHYVRQNSLVDEEALNRGNSTYFPIKVVPMLPEVLSNELCSLNPNKKRAVLVCEMSISGKGKIGSAKFFEGWIKSSARLTYNQVASFIEDGDDSTIPDEEVKTNLTSLHDLYGQLSVQRAKRGALDLDIPETKIVFSEDKKIEKITPSSRNVAHKIIEECMLMANVAASDFFVAKDLPSLYRNHAKPKPEKLKDLISQLGLHGINVPQSVNSAYDLKDAIEQIKTRDDAGLMQMMILHSLQQAEYGSERIGHFGLALKNYSHFTSPIRRYPDLVVHRTICDHLRNSKPTYTVKELKSIGTHSSMTERRSETAEREVVSYLKCEYMVDHVGNNYLGTISGVTDFGVFVTLKDFFVDGLVHITSLKDDYYKYDSKKLCLQGEHTGITYKLGDELDVTVASVNLENRRIDFTLT